MTASVQDIICFMIGAFVLGAIVGHRFLPARSTRTGGKE